MVVANIVKKEKQDVAKVNNKPKRIIYFDILNILACIAVIAMHCNGIVHTYSDTHAWAESLVVEVVCYWAVPIYLMLSGATLMNYREKYDTKTFFKKRVKKVLIPFVIWAIIMTVIKVMRGTLVVENWSLSTIFNIFFRNEEEATYYFMFIILGVYLTMPILSILAESKYRKVLWYAVIVMFITKTLLPVNYFGIEYNPYLSVLFDGYLIFVMLGYLLSTMELNKTKRYIIYALGILSCIFRYVVTYVLSTKAGEVNRWLFGYVQFHSVFLAVAVFVFIKNINWDKIIKSDKIKNAIAKIAGCSFGIYLMHQIVMGAELQVLGWDVYSLKWRTVGAIFTYLISLAIVYIIKKIPVLKKIVP